MFEKNGYKFLYRTWTTRNEQQQTQFDVEVRKQMSGIEVVALNCSVLIDGLHTTLSDAIMEEAADKIIQSGAI